MAKMELWHGSTTRFDAFDATPAKQGGRVVAGLHFGSEAQARMRNARVLYRVEVDVQNPRRSRDEGGQWASKIASAKTAGHDAIVYLNRYEGIPVERIEALAAAGLLDKLDRMDDRAFRRAVPEAEDSVIVLDPSRIRILEVIEAVPQPPRIVAAPEPDDGPSP